MEEGYCEKYDAYYDLKTGEWTESKCDDPNCEFCANRPEKYTKECDADRKEPNGN